MHRTVKVLAILALSLSLAACDGDSSAGNSADAEGGVLRGERSGPSKSKVLRMPIRSDGPKSLDPVKGSTVYDNHVVSQVYETLLQYRYLARPPQLEPLLLAEMPSISNEGRTYHFRLKEGVYFHDDPCFPGGKGRELVTSDVFFSWKRMADNKNLPKSWWLFANTVVGFDEFREQQNAAEPFDYHSPVEGFREINRHEFEVELVEPVTRFLWVLAMFQTSIVPHEATEVYGKRFSRHPVGTGPFTMEEDDWTPGLSLRLNRNRNYHPCFYPAEHMADDEPFGFHLPAGEQLPICDRIEFRFFRQDQPLWLKFRTGQIDYTQVPAEFFRKAFIRRTQQLRPQFREEGIVDHAVPLLDFIFRGFNMQDAIVGGYSDKNKALRQAMSLAVDLDEFNETFYNGLNRVYDGPIPPGLAGHPAGGTIPIAFRGPDLERARQLMDKAGYPGGKGLPDLEYYIGLAANSAEQAELLRRQMGAIGIRLDVRLVDFSTLIEAVHNKKAQMFSFAWGSDYPDAENNLALFYGPNEAPGSNSFNYHNAEYDKLYEQIRSMPLSPERTQIVETMRDSLLEDVPYLGSMARIRYYLVNPRLKNFKPTEDSYNWYKYLDVEE